MSVSYLRKAHEAISIIYMIYLKNQQPQIKFPIQHNSKELAFLYITIKNQNGQIIRGISQKPIDNSEYLHLKSYHLKTA